MNTISFCWTAPFPWDADRQQRAPADTTLIPAAQYLFAKGLEQLLQTVQKSEVQINPKLKN